MKQAKDATALDLVRGLAALAVVFYHARATSLPAFDALPISDQSAVARLLYAATKLGRDGVLIFFVLSGFLVFGRIIQRLGSFDAQRYATERATRILIPLIPACVLTAIVGVVVGYPVTALGTVAHMVGLNGVLLRTYQVNAPLWTLAYEIWFYILGGAVAAIAARRSPAIALPALAIALVVFTKLDARYLLYWLLGGMMILVERNAGRWALLGLPVALAGAVVFGENFARPSGNPEAAAIGETLISVGFALNLPLLASEAATRRLAWLKGLASGLSAISYSLYLTHLPTLTLTRLVLAPALRSVAGGTLDMLVRVLVCIVAAAAFWWAFERNTGAARGYVYARRAEREPSVVSSTP